MILYLKTICVYRRLTNLFNPRSRSVRIMSVTVRESEDGEHTEPIRNLAVKSLTMKDGSGANL